MRMARLPASRQASDRFAGQFRPRRGRAVDRPRFCSGNPSGLEPDQLNGWYFVITPCRLGRAHTGGQGRFPGTSTFEVGLFGWMAIMQLVLFRPSHPATDAAAF